MDGGWEYGDYKKEIADKGEKRNNEEKRERGMEHGRIGRMRIRRKEKTRARGTSCRKSRDAM